MRSFRAFLLALPFAVVGLAAAAPPPPTFTLQAGGDHFGSAAAFAGSNVLIGAPFDDAAAPNAGAAHLFGGTSGSLLRTFPNPTLLQDQFGRSVASRGTSIVVGAPYADAGADDGGAAYVIDEATGNVLQTLRVPEPTGHSLFGLSVAVLGGNLLVGAPGGDIGDTDNAGAAYLFDPNGNLLRTFTSPAAVKGDKFGYAVAALGSMALVGAPAAHAGAVNTGAAYLLDPGTGALLTTFVNPTPSRGDQFGATLAAAGPNALVGAPLDDTGAAVGAGAAYLFDATGALLRTFKKPAPAQGERCGTAVAAVESLIVLGCPSDITGASESGVVYVFDAASGSLLETYQRPAPEARAHFGSAVAAAGTRLAVGAPDDELGGHDMGAAYVFELPEVPGGGPGGEPCVSDADCGDEDLFCTDDTCSAALQCTHTEKVGFDAVACRLAALDAALHDALPNFRARLGARLVRVVKKARARVEVARHARPRRARRKLVKVGRQLVRFELIVQRATGRGRIRPEVSQQLTGLSGKAQSKLKPLIASLRRR